MRRLGSIVPVPTMIALIGLSLSGARSTAASSPRAPGPCPATWTVASTPNVGEGDNQLVAAASTSSTDVWAVGNYLDGVAHTLIEHWDGQAWSIVPSPNVEGVNNFLLAVNALSPTDAWAVGYSEDPSGIQPARTLTEHWDGIAWAIVDSPNLGFANDDNYLEGVKEFSAGDVWAVGYYYGTNMAFHWDGSSWTSTEPPHPMNSLGTFLYAIDGVSSNDLWAAGYYFDSSLNANQPLFDHWDGTAWSPYQFPGIETSDIAFAVVTESSSDAWAVGTTDDPSAPGSLFAQHWDRTQWRDNELLPGTKSNVNEFFGLAAFSGSDLWATGYYLDESTGADRILAEHYDGVQYDWTILPTPTVGTGDSRLGGITATSDVAELWTVGLLHRSGHRGPPDPGHAGLPHPAGGHRVQPRQGQGEPPPLHHHLDHGRGERLARHHRREWAAPFRFGPAGSPGLLRPRVLGRGDLPGDRSGHRVHHDRAGLPPGPPTHRVDLHHLPHQLGHAPLLRKPGIRRPDPPPRFHPVGGLEHRRPVGQGRLHPRCRPRDLLLPGPAPRHQHGRRHRLLAACFDHRWLIPYCRICISSVKAG